MKIIKFLLLWMCPFLSAIYASLNISLNALGEKNSMDVTGQSVSQVSSEDSQNIYSALFEPGHALLTANGDLDRMTITDKFATLLTVVVNTLALWLIIH